MTATMSTAKIREVIEDLSPPVVHRFLLRVYLSARGLGWNRFYGTYATLADVPSTPDGQNSDWYVQSAIEQIEGLKPEISRRPMGDDAGLLMLPLLISESLEKDETITVLDFGGGAAHGLKFVLQHVPQLDPARFRYVLVETPAMCQAIREPLFKMQRERFGGASFVEVADEIPTSLPHPLIVHARGSIQYLNDYRAALSRLLALGPETFVLAHTPVTDAPTFAQEQRNQPHRVLARWIFNRKELISEIEASGFSLAFIFDHGSPELYKMSSPLNDVTMLFHKRAHAR